MGDNIYLGDRDGVRTPMQWSPDRNGGFSRADPAALLLPPIMDPLYGYEAVNVEAQQRDPHSLLQLDAAHARRCAGSIRRSAAARCASSIRGNRKVLAYLREYEDETHPLRRQRLAHRPGGRARSLGVRRPRAGRADRRLAAFPPIGQLTYLLTLPPYGFYWFVLAGAEPSRRAGTRRRRNRCPSSSRSVLAQADRRCDRDGRRARAARARGAAGAT